MPGDDKLRDRAYNDRSATLIIGLTLAFQVAILVVLLWL